MKEKKKRKRKNLEKQKKKQQQHIAEEDPQENGHSPVETELGGGEVLVVPKELIPGGLQSSQVKKTKVSENLDAFTHFEFSSQNDDPKDAAAVSGKVSYEVKGPGGSIGKKKYKRRGKSVKVEPKSVDYVFDTENEDDSVEEEPAMVRIKIEPEDSHLMQMMEKTKNINKSKTTKRKGRKPYAERPDYFGSDMEYNVNMAVEDSMKNLDNFSGQILTAVKWILSQNKVNHKTAYREDLSWGVY